MSVYTSLGNASVKLVAKYGSVWDLYVKPADNPLNATPWRPEAAADIKSTPKGVLTSFDKEEIDGESIKASDLKLLVAAGDPALVVTGFDPLNVVYADKNGKRYGASLVQPVDPGDVPLIYTYRLRLG